MSEMWILFLVIGVMAIKIVRAYQKQEWMQKTIDVLTICTQEQQAAMKNMNDLLIDKLPHLKEEVDAEMEKWRKEQQSV